MALRFRVLGEWFRREDFRGCFFLNAASEYSGLEPRIQEAVAGHKRRVRELLERLASQAGARDANGLAGRLALLVEGAIAVALVERDADGAGVAKDAARVLIRAALPKPPTRSSGGARSPVRGAVSDSSHLTILDRDILLNADHSAPGIAERLRRQP